MEFRNPVFNHPLPPQTCDRVFAFQPDGADIEDETPAVTAEMTKRASELTQPSAAR